MPAALTVTIYIKTPLSNTITAIITTGADCWFVAIEEDSPPGQAYQIGRFDGIVFIKQCCPIVHIINCNKQYIWAF